jgi:ribosomal protein L17
MRHRHRKAKLGRTTEHRTALLSNLVCSLIKHRRIETTLAKAKAARVVADKMVTLSKKGQADEVSLQYRRRVAARLQRHHRNAKDKLANLTKINRYHCTLFAHFLDRLKGIKEGDGTLLDHSMVVYGGAIGDGNRHTHHDLPVVLAGRGNGMIETGRHVRYPTNTPMANLFLNMLDIMDAPVDRLGDSTGRLKGLS